MDSGHNQYQQGQWREDDVFNQDNNQDDYYQKQSGRGMSRGRGNYRGGDRRQDRFRDRDNNDHRNPQKRQFQQNTYFDDEDGDQGPQREVELNKVQKAFIDKTIQIHSQQVVDEFRHKNSIIVKTKGIVPQPFIQWKDANFPPYISGPIQEMQYDHPTPIQAQVLPILLAGCDLIGIAQTGSGKTASFVIPALIHINAQEQVKANEGPIVVILVPTRELAIQIQENISIFAKYCKVNSVCCYGGQSRDIQTRQLAKGVDVVVATPGRLIDFLNSKETNLDRTTYLVLDEADRMLDMGFEPQVREILSFMRPDKQTSYFSATWPKSVEKLAIEICQNDPIHIQIGKSGLTINKDIQQIVYCVRRNEKFNKLMDVLDKLTRDDKVLIFAQTKISCEELAQRLCQEQFHCLSLHGDKNQSQRDYVMKQFKASQARLVCATDVASRGLDVRDITTVVLYDFPKQIEDYIHRIGRTGRAGDSGSSITFLTYGEDQPYMAKQLIRVLKEAAQDVPQDLYDFIAGNTPQTDTLRQGSQQGLKNYNQGQRYERFGGNQRQGFDQDMQQQSNYRGGGRGYQGRGDRGDYQGNRGNRGDRGDREDRGGYQGNRGDRGGYQGNRGDRGGYQGNRGNRGDRGEYNQNNRRGDDRGNRRNNMRFNQQVIYDDSDDECQQPDQQQAGRRGQRYQGD